MQDAAEAKTLWSVDEPVGRLRGVGPKVQGLLARAEIQTLGDLLRTFPRRHQEVVELEEPSDLHLGSFVRLRGVVTSVSLAWLPGRRSMVTVNFVTPSGEPFRVQFFNQPYLKKSYKPGLDRQLEGTLDRSKSAFVLKGARVVSPNMQADGPCLVRYREIDGVSEQRLRSLIDQALRGAELRRDFDEGLPQALAARSGLDLPDVVSALRSMHQPQSLEAHEAARVRFALLEAVRLFRRVEGVRRIRAAAVGPDVRLTSAHAERMARVIPFEWTQDQAKAVALIRSLLCENRPMGLLLQGDVGTGKTAVAIDAALAVIASGHQVAFLAPTELLAEQQYAVVRQWLADEDVGVAFLTGRMNARERRGVTDRLIEGSAQLVFGTHALLSEDTKFKALGLVVVDEQHRFGVVQRQRLVAKGRSPHVMVMTATPIPRTLALTLFGDLDVEVLRQRPPGRRSPHSLFLPREAWSKVMKTVARHVRRGGRVYVVCPKVGEDGAKGGAVLMARELGKHFDCGLVHGRMDVRDRQRATQAFRDGGTPVLVGTTVLEVGVDVAEATLMVVVGADRFGLATLHQLRGRVGRGARRGLCILTGEPTARTAAIVRTTNGFELAEEDLRQRGAGELLGAQQTGSADFAALDPIEDYDLLLAARHAVREEK